MKKMNNKGFVLAETLIVTVFLMVLFTLIYSNFYPLIGEYEKREVYDDVDGKYAVYWIKKLIEDSEYSVSSTKLDELSKNGNGYFRFECSDFPKSSDKGVMCANIVRALEIKGCNEFGNNCDIFVTNYSLSGGIQPDFKEHLDDTSGMYEGCTLEKYVSSPGTYGKEEDQDRIINEINDAYPYETGSSTDTCTGQVLTYLLNSGELSSTVLNNPTARKKAMVDYLNKVKII